MPEPIDMIGVPEILFDGIADIKFIEGVVRLALFARRDGESIIVARVAIPLSELPDIIQQLVMSLTEAAKVVVKPVLS